MKIICRSIPENWEKEKNGSKPNTLRILPNPYTKDTIEVVNTLTGESFQRDITDITIWQGNMIISWKHKEEKI